MEQGQEWERRALFPGMEMGMRLDFPDIRTAYGRNNGATLLASAMEREEKSVGLRAEWAWDCLGSSDDPTRRNWLDMLPFCYMDGAWTFRRKKSRRLRRL